MNDITQYANVVSIISSVNFTGLKSLLIHYQSSKANTPFEPEVTFVSKGDAVCHADEKMKSEDRYSVCQIDCNNLSRMELRQKYHEEATCHRNMKYRSKVRGAIIHQDFLEFAGFLRIVGPIPEVGATIDRINNCDPEYAPGKVRWADKRTQNSNKSDTLIFHDKDGNETFTTFRLSKLQGVSPSAIRQRHLRGWSDADIIRGARVHKPKDEMDIKAKVYRGAKSSAAETKELSCAEWDFRREAECYRAHREKYGEEAFIPTFSELHELCAEVGQIFTQSHYESHVRRLWPKHRSHVNFDNLNDESKAIIAIIDPKFVEQWNHQAKNRDKLRKVL